MKKTFATISLFLAIVFIGCKTKQLTPEQQAKANAFIEKIERGNYVFHPTDARPMIGRSIILNYDYHLKVSKDTIDAYLPYFGRSFTVPADPKDISIEFVSTNFTYSENKKENGTHEIKIEPKDITNSQNEGIVLLLSISPSGYATLNAQPINRQPISFYGTVD